MGENYSMRPADFTDAGNAVVFVREYRDGRYNHLLYRNEAAAFARLDIAQPLAVERVQQAQTAEELLRHLAQF